VKIIDLRDSTGSGDVDISTIVKVTSNNNRQDESIQGLSGRKLKVEKKILLKRKRKIFFLKIPSDWKNPSGNYHIGIKSLKHLIPSCAFDRIIVKKIKRKN
jgi:tripeptidyl-peptidase-2